MANESDKERLSILSSGVTEVIELLERGDDRDGLGVDAFGVASRLREVLQRAYSHAIEPGDLDPTIYGVCKEPECRHVYTRPFHRQCPKCGSEEPPLTPDEAAAKREKRLSGGIDVDFDALKQAIDNVQINTLGTASAKRTGQIPASSATPGPPFTTPGPPFITTPRSFQARFYQDQMKYILDPPPPLDKEWSDWSDENAE